MTRKIEKMTAHELEALAIELLEEAGTKEAQEWLNLYSDNGFIDDDDIARIIAKYAVENVNAKATRHNFKDIEIRDMRQMRANGETLKMIANIYGCSQALVSKIVRKQLYKDVR